MTPEERRRIKALAAEARGRPQADRQAVLSAAGASDMALRALRGIKPESASPNQCREDRR